MWLAWVDAPATTHGCRVSWLEGTLAGEYRIGRPAYVSSAALVVVLRHCIPTQMPLTLTRAERGTVSVVAKAEDRQTDTHWRHPQGELQQEQLDLLHAALARARYDRRLARTPVQLGAGQWCRGIDADAAAIMAVLTVRGGRGGLLCTVMLWERAQAGLRPTGRTTTVSSRRLRRLTVIDSRTGDVASAASAHGPSLLVQMDGVARLRMATCLARYDVATGRSWRANEPGLIVPVRQTATRGGGGADCSGCPNGRGEGQCGEMAADDQPILVDAGDCGLHPGEVWPPSEPMPVLPGTWVGGSAHTDARRCRVPGVECSLGVGYGDAPQGWCSPAGGGHQGAVADVWARGR